jgi:hypothetical protein
MSVHEQAELVLKLYELRRETTMRAARDWYFREFNPESLADVDRAMFGDHNGHLRMVVGYWEMVAALVNHGAIDLELFNDTNGEHVGVFAKLERLLPEIRAKYGPQMAVQLEKLIDATPGGRERIATFRERVTALRAEMAASRAQSASQG